MNEYTNAVLKNRDLITKFCIEKQNNGTRASVQSSIAEENLVKSLLPTAKKFADAIGLTYNNIKEVTQITSPKDYEKALVGTLLLASEINNLNYQKEFNTRGEELSKTAF
ncbi:hypothetical protein ETF27_08015 [Prevotella brunnea]|uniref:Uncharacterized protein n=1 Tax=Prevotella brunnea TaxID=2508867 RepID=A0A5C8GI95_9BACT|nr:hypothetical protein [Prevotella brunnea]TXJ60908.1 hypothetical protein ETF27_08015 [Prevotella brunnea]